MTPTDDPASLFVKVIPRSSRDQIVSYAGGVLTVKLTAPPVEGAANAALIKLLAKELRLRRSQISIKSGRTSRTKRLHIEGITGGELDSLLRRFAAPCRPGGAR
jgi:uncharacterized protein (TIGR00251 family)